MEFSVLADCPEEAGQKIAAIEDQHFWFSARADLIVSHLGRAMGSLRGKRVVDIGCGTGYVLGVLDGAGMATTGCDMHMATLAIARKRTRADLICMDANDLPPGNFDAALLCDVIEHVVDDVALVRTASASVRPGGIVLITVPAHQWLWTVIDDVSGHKRRYSLQQLEATMHQADLSDLQLSYFNRLLLPVQALRKLLLRGDSDEQRIHQMALALPPPPLNRLMGQAMKLDRLLWRRIPGATLIATGRVTAATNRAAARCCDLEMPWLKLGNIFTPQSTHEKLLSHAANPLPRYLGEDTFRVFYNGRDANNRSSVGYFDFDIATSKVIYAHNDPVFLHGDQGTFYADGLSIGDCFEVGGRTYMLFMGWQSAPGKHWWGEVGRLIVSEDLSLSLDPATPLLALDAIDPISLSYPCVLHRDSGFDMWYGSTLTWDAGNNEMVHVLKRAHSRDGQAWERTGESIPHSIGVAQVFSRPTIAVGANGGFEMWFSYRSGAGGTYRIGYARSVDGYMWRLALDEAGISTSPDGWDSQMIEYPYVFDHKGHRYMLYCGDGYGASGIGLAVAQ